MMPGNAVTRDLKYLYFFLDFYFFSCYNSVWISDSPNEEKKQMPVAEERKLKAQARKKGLKGKAADAYVYETLNKIEKARAKKGKRKK